MQTKLILLTDIEPLRNYREVIPVSAKDPDVIELAATMKQHGQLQACLVRLHPKKDGKYQLYIGFRRLMAAGLAGLQSLKCEVKEVPDDDILELQLIENLQRQNPHPLDEAIAYQTIMDKKKWTVAEIAARFNKKEDYITQRLKLNDLVAPAQKLFKEDKFLLGHALLLARLTAEDQNEILKKQKDFGSVAQLTDYINRNIIRSLSQASFDIKDPNLFPQAGACTTCPKRSGCNTSLFPDIKALDRCFDKKCFQQKSDIAFFANVKEVMETKPEIHFIAGMGERVSTGLHNDLQKFKIKILREYTDFRDDNYSGDFQLPAKGLWLTGHNQGKIVSIRLKGRSAGSKSGSKDTGNTKEDLKTIIAGIQQRTKRSAELDAEKVHGRITDAMEEHSTQKTVDAKMKTMPEPDHVAMMYILFHELEFSDREDVVKKLKIKGWEGRMNAKNAAAFYLSLREISTGELAYIVRKIMLSKHAGSTNASDEGYIIRKMAESYKDIPIAQYEKEQKEIRDRREERAAGRIAALQPKKSKKVNGKKVKSALKGKVITKKIKSIAKKRKAA